MNQKQRIRVEMWSKERLYQEMACDGWQPGTVDGKFTHKNGKSIDMMSRNQFGALWLQFAAANTTPSPF